MKEIKGVTKLIRWIE